jgi:hypothetical protein
MLATLNAMRRLTNQQCSCAKWKTHLNQHVPLLALGELILNLQWDCTAQVLVRTHIQLFSSAACYGNAFDSDVLGDKSLLSTQTHCCLNTEAAVFTIEPLPVKQRASEPLRAELRAKKINTIYIQN